MFSSSISSQTSSTTNQPSSHKTGNQPQISTQSYMIITQYGDMLVVKQSVQHHHHHHHHAHSHSNSPSNSQTGEQQQHQTRPIIMTFHDLGLNSELQFATFCECEEVKLMLQTFTMIHVNFIGQETLSQHNQTFNSTESGSRTSASLADDFKYPSVEQMAESIVDICAQLRVRSFIAIAVGAGAHIVGSLALMRPDLVDGLFLINPVISSCSITEWLYFKMSAIASNHRIGSWSSTDSPNATQIETGSESNDSPKRGGHSSSKLTTTTGKGLRKLLNTAHIHLPIHHHSYNNSEEAGHSNAADQQDDLLSIGQISSQSGSSLNSSLDNQQLGSSPGRAHPTGSRLRQLIFSRNFRLRGGHHSKLARATSMSPAGEASVTAQSNQMRRSDTLKSGADGANTDNTEEDSINQADNSSDGEYAKSSHRKPPGSSGSADSTDSQSHRASTGKRPPTEYLMYHHFGSASFQRFRRSSDNTLPAVKYDLGQRDSNDTTSSADQQLGTPRSTSTAGSGSRMSRLTHTCSQSQDCLEDSPTGSAGNPLVGRNRSGSVVCMERSCLAAFTNDRQRHAYMQSVYKNYFNQLDAHNLWLFAQSFAKRRNLNLRKDCGAAAHAAAAAATLGTSICNAFVGPAAALAPSSGPARTAGEHQAPTVVQPGTTLGSNAAAPTKSSGARAGSQRPHRQQAASPQVAGTKVKRTFNCQTLIMCSSVQMHCERAFKLMSLLNPLQATWIKTDHLLVLEERPDKVCQALRLFLQGIGYSMSTYERRLRLSSATGSASSADSGGSARSLDEKG